MRSALYGRFKPCIERDYGYVGCQSDVLTLADSLCSGKRECELKIPVEKFGVNSTCPRDLSRHLQAEFSCVKVITPNRTYCYSRKTATLPSTGGWIAYRTTEETGCGSTETPWVIRTDPGQTLNFTLHDFALKSAIYNDSARYLAAASHCQVYAIFKEKLSKRSKTICGGDTRVSQAYVTSANEVEIRVMVGTAQRYFALEYEVQGCPDPVQPIGGWIERRGDEVTMGCNSDDITRTLTCKGNQWNGTRVKDCSKGPAAASIFKIMYWNGWSFHYNEEGLTFLWMGFE
ncbi:hypothetical protein CAPTEDRAFT_208208 [Capitella teleta]|uniref:SUEL-type lectin domain-containing protein n=1 Tax=Capitella teleta TaxID=283909 RepID=R7VCG2_CAPTE|nr:hypothetical protein CAPTEDRAFT_208208 [Capitella teleta]|eukprot:ELU13375.1 hypothetical protein CAPTEDRAFT_208208 [Capitella teleta]